MPSRRAGVKSGLHCCSPARRAAVGCWAMPGRGRWVQCGQGIRVDEGIDHAALLRLLFHVAGGSCGGGLWRVRDVVDAPLPTFPRCAGESLAAWSVLKRIHSMAVAEWNVRLSNSAGTW